MGRPSAGTIGRSGESQYTVISMSATVLWRDQIFSSGLYTTITHSPSGSITRDRESADSCRQDNRGEPLRAGTLRPCFRKSWMSPTR